jgi:hypothetical protein
MRHLWSQVWIALRWFWSFREASSAKVAVVVAGEVGRSENTALWNTGVDWW